MKKVDIFLNTPLADALSSAIQPKLVELEWGTRVGIDESSLAEYIILMLVNGKTRDQILAELSGELLGMPQDDPGVHDFCGWLFEQIDILNAQVNGDPSAGGEAIIDAQQNEPPPVDMDTDMTANDLSDFKAPTGPRSMRNGSNRGGRDKRMLGQMNKAMDRSAESALHRTRGNDRINTHHRAPPTGPRIGQGRLPRHNNNNRPGPMLPGMVGPPANWMMAGAQPNQMDLMAMIEQQNQMMYQLSQQLIAGSNANGGHSASRRGKSLFDRVSEPHNRNNFRKNNHHQRARANADEAPRPDQADGEDVDMSGGIKREPDESVCKYNLNCTNKECKFAHQSPAAPLGVSIDVSDTCSFGAACKNRKCVGRHPSPAAKLAHQSEQDCKFFPNCHNARCPFKHPSMPLCRNGPDCSTASCRFTHVKTKCKFSPCLNPSCVFAHEEGQQGGFKDKVWTAGHVSERRFVDEEAEVEQVKAEEGGDMAMGRASDEAEVVV
ncbi:hypothetical protein CDD80_3911 [Ophiocordyceps camponoti-rufipedis]|uniref:Nab2-like CCCH zinc finger domain-containing protein n=1 Tax=Ophiocordyceps camponoti-rufipedis TaxID=2004952 RepID=A0A2C5Z0B0_9HYPO|nr:hypothetical protein CDD80_3911 [Ophiocordyceps camponoti-rufipedis]